MSYKYNPFTGKFDETGSAGANTTLSNLTSPTAINRDLIFDKSLPILKTKNDTVSEQLLITTGDASAGDSGDLIFTTGSASVDRGDIILDATSLLLVNYAEFSNINTNNNSWGSDLPGLTIKGDSTEANTAGAGGLVFNDPTGVNYFFVGTNDANNIGTTSNIYMTSGDNAGTGKSGDVDILSGQATGGGDSGYVQIQTQNSTSGNSGNMFLSTGPAASGTSGNINLTTSNSANIRGSIVMNSNGLNLVNVGNVALPIASSNPSAPVEGSSYIFSSGGTYEIRSYIAGGWRSVALT